MHTIFIRNTSVVHRFLPLLAFIGTVVLSATAWATPVSSGSITVQKTRTMEMAAGKSMLLHSPVPVKRVSVANPEIASVLVLSPTQLYVTGKAPGTTNITTWDRRNNPSEVFDLIVVPDVIPLKQLLHDVLPEERELKVLTAGESITLAGVVSSSPNMDAALSLAEAYAPGQVINLLQVGGVHQVMLEVRVAEMSRSLMRRLGVNLNYIQQGAALLNGGVFYTFLNQLTHFNEEGEFILSDKVNGAFSFQKGGATWSGFIDALKENGLVKVLAEPNLVCLSGQNANFLAGGEFPVPVPQGLGTVGVDFKKFGVSLNFTPVVLSEDRISVQVQPEVSEIDFTVTTKIGGTQVPGLSTRRASTTVELGSGQSFAIAGLIKDNMREALSKVPALGEIPVLGMLFRSTEYQKNQSELIIIVTPHLVKPLNMADQTLPTDGFVDPNDFEFYVMGMAEGRNSRAGMAPPRAVPASASGKAGFDGEFGHTVPVP